VADGRGEEALNRGLALGGSSLPLSAPGLRLVSVLADPVGTQLGVVLTHGGRNSGSDTIFAAADTYPPPSPEVVGVNFPTAGEGGTLAWVATIPSNKSSMFLTKP
jgi:hypothetical protein